MMDVDLETLFLGLLVGTGISVLFFAGLSLGMRVALHASQPTPVLLLSAGLRISLLLAIGWIVAQAGAWAFFGYAVSFLLVRHVAIAITQSNLVRDNI